MTCTILSQRICTTCMRCTQAAIHTCTGTHEHMFRIVAQYVYCVTINGEIWIVQFLLPDTQSTTTKAPSVTRKAAVTSDEKSTWPGESIKLIKKPFSPFSHWSAFWMKTKSLSSNSKYMEMALRIEGITNNNKYEFLFRLNSIYGWEDEWDESDESKNHK